ncbi:MAG: extracellular solute-binding protein, partial [Alphaproteobacteria bacterium]|nr:extracellular solute-binding protein [Alphaproteobacteria bacterium]
MFRIAGAGALAAGGWAALAMPAKAQIEIQWWHAMTGANNTVIEKLAADFNAAQKEYKVVPTFKGSYPDTMNAGIAAFRAGNAPHIMQVFEVGTATMMAAKGAVKPVQEMMKEAGEKFDPNSYLPAITGYYSTAKGDMLSFPFNSSSTVMWYNKDAFKKAGLDPSKPPKTWPETFAYAKKLKAAGYATCGVSNAWTTWVLLEQFSAWHNVPLGTKANGLDGFDTELKFNTPLHVRLLSEVVELQKDKTYDYAGRTNAGEG